MGCCGCAGCCRKPPNRKSKNPCASAESSAVADAVADSRPTARAARKLGTIWWPKNTARHPRLRLRTSAGFPGALIDLLNLGKNRAVPNRAGAAAKTASACVMPRQLFTDVQRSKYSFNIDRPATLPAYKSLCIRQPHRFATFWARHKLIGADCSHANSLCTATTPHPRT